MNWTVYLIVLSILSVAFLILVVVLLIREIIIGRRSRRYWDEAEEAWRKGGKQALLDFAERERHRK